jgi:hypothetical protein
MVGSSPSPSLSHAFSPVFSPFSCAPKHIPVAHLPNPYQILARRSILGQIRWLAILSFLSHEQIRRMRGPFSRIKAGGVGILPRPDGDNSLTRVARSYLSRAAAGPILPGAASSSLVCVRQGALAKVHSWLPIEHVLPSPPYNSDDSKKRLNQSYKNVVYSNMPEMISAHSSMHTFPCFS